MKNYALNKEESKNFITEFKILEDRIIVFFGDGHNEIKEKTPEEIERIVSILENQIKHSTRKQEQLYDHIRTCIKSAFYFIVFSVTVTCCLNYYGYNANPLFLVPAGTLLTSSILVFKDRSTLKDIRKHQTFLENKENILENIKSNPTVLTNTSLLTQGLIDSEKKNPTEFFEDEPINLHNIHEIPEYDINLIMENIDCIDSLGYTTPEREDKVIRFRPNKKR